MTLKSTVKSRTHDISSKSDNWWIQYGTSFRNLDEYSNIHISWLDLLNGGFAAATVLVSFGVVIGKTTPMQLLGMATIEVPLFVVNCYIGYTLIGAVDVGGAIFIHTFGAYFGLFVRLVCFQ